MCKFHLDVGTCLRLFLTVLCMPVNSSQRKIIKNTYKSHRSITRLQETVFWKWSNFGSISVRNFASARKTFVTKNRNSAWQFLKNYLQNFLKKLDNCLHMIRPFEAWNFRKYSMFSFCKIWFFQRMCVFGQVQAFFKRFLRFFVNFSTSNSLKIFYLFSGSCVVDCEIQKKICCSNLKTEARTFIGFWWGIFAFTRKV